MNRPLRALSFVAAAAALALAACGSGDDDDSAGTVPGTTGGGTAATVSVAAVDGIGDVLVDSSGQALYTADEEVAAGNEVLCVDGCTAFWEPLEPGDAAPTAAPGVPELGMVERPDGTEQVTADGHLLYTFAQDSPGSVTGDGFEDDFGDQHLTWHVVRADGASAPASDAPPATSGGGFPGYGD